MSACESGMTVNHIGDSSLPSTIAYHLKGQDYGESVGAFQIRLLPGRPDRKWLLDIDNNIAYAYRLSQGGTQWQPWSCAKIVGLVP